MAVVYRTAGAWGAGLGVNLSAAQVDGNFYDLETRVEDIEAGGVQPTNIESITVVGSQMTIFMEDASVFGPFTLPIATLHWRGEWEVDEDYNELDIVYVTDDGAYLVLHDHTADSYEFDSGAINEDSEPLYFRLFAVPVFLFEIPFFIPGKPAADGLVFQHVTSQEWRFPQFFGTGTGYSGVKTLDGGGAAFRFEQWKAPAEAEFAFVDSDPDTITRDSGNFVLDGAMAGGYVTVFGSASNDGTYLIDTVTALTLTLDAAETLVTESAVSCSLTFHRQFGTLTLLDNGSVSQDIPDSVDFTINDVLKVYAPTVQDPDLADISFTINATTTA